MTVKSLLVAIAVLGLLSSCGSSDAPQPNINTNTNTSSIVVKVSEAGAPSYNLNEAKLLSSNYQTGASSLSIMGKLNNGKVLTLNFSRGSGSVPAYTTNVLDATLDNVVGTNATGATTFNTTKRTADGSYQVTFPTIGVISGSFTGL